MSAARVRRGASGRTSGKARKGGRSVTVPKKLAAHLPVEEAQANRLAAWAFGLFILLLAGAALVALDVPAKAGHALGEAVGDAGFRVRSVDVQGIKRMNPKPVYQIALDQKTTAMPLVDVSGIRERLLGFGWVKDARVSRRLPDTLVIDIVERQPSALWQDGNSLSLIDAEGVVLDRVPVSQMPDLPLLVGAGANRHSVALEALLEKVPSIKAQLVSANWVGGRRWDLVLQSGETLALPEGDADAADALVKFARMDKQSGILGRGIVRIDLRVPGKMIVQLPHEVDDATVSQPQSAG